MPPNHITKDFLLPLVTGFTLCLTKDAKNNEELAAIDEENLNKIIDQLAEGVN